MKMIGKKIETSLSFFPGRKDEEPAASSHGAGKGHFVPFEMKTQRNLWNFLIPGLRQLVLECLWFLGRSRPHNSCHYSPARQMTQDSLSHPILYCSSQAAEGRAVALHTSHAEKPHVCLVTLHTCIRPQVYMCTQDTVTHSFPNHPPTVPLPPCSICIHVHPGTKTQAPTDTRHPHLHITHSYLHACPFHPRATRCAAPLLTPSLSTLLFLLWTASGHQLLSSQPILKCSPFPWPAGRVPQLHFFLFILTRRFFEDQVTIP